MAILVFIFILGLLIVVHEFGHFIVAKKVGIRVEKFSLGFGPQLFKKKRKETEYSVSLIPLGGFVKLAGDNLEEYKGKEDEYFAQSIFRRFSVIFFGPLLNYVLGFLCFWLIFCVGYPSLTTKVGGLMEGFGAVKAGLQVRDKILSVDGKKVEYWEDLQNLIYTKKDESKVKLMILRDNQEMAVDVNIKEKSVDDPLGQKRNVGLLGITPLDEIVIVKHGIFESFFLGINKTWDLTVLTYKGLWRMITGKLSVRESVTGPLGIFFITSQAASAGALAVLHLIAVLSVSLAIFNLLPLPILDGGHILFLGIEKIRGKTFGLKTEKVITKIGVTIILSIALLVTYNDFLRFFGDKITNFFK